MNLANKIEYHVDDLVAKQSVVLRHSCTFTSWSLPSDRHPERNEDSLVVDRRRGLAAVFDGVGGKDDGHIASEAAAQYLLQAWKELFEQLYWSTEETHTLSSDPSTLIKTLI